MVCNENESDTENRKFPEGTGSSTRIIAKVHLSRTVERSTVYYEFEESSM